MSLFTKLLFGSLVEFNALAPGGHHLNGEDIGTLRNMANPPEFTQPNTYEGNSWAPTAEGEGDFGGVHSNSGIQNFWFFLISEGGTGVNDNGDAYAVSPIGRDKAAQVSFRNLTTQLTSESTIADAAQGSINVATNEYGACSFEVDQIRDAWFAVGVLDAPADPFHWQGGCACSFHDLNIEINTTLNYVAQANFYNINGNLVVKSGNTLVLRPGVKINMCSPESKVIVEKGATLIMNNARFTTSGTERWQGVEVYGNNLSKAPRPTNAQLLDIENELYTTYNNTSNTGIVIMVNSSTIQNAQEGFRNHMEHADGWSYPAYTGGMIYAKNSSFYNCKRSAEFLTSSASSRFVDCFFKVDNSFLLDDVKDVSCTSAYQIETVRHFVTILNNSAIEFRDCDFDHSNNKPNLLYRGAGIYSIDSKYKVFSTEFKGLFDGIYISNTGARLGNVIASANEFNSVTHGITFKGAFDASLSMFSGNTFKIPNGIVTSSSSRSSWGINMEGAQGFNITGNKFYGPTNNKALCIGLFLNNTSFVGGGRVQSNEFKNLIVGTQTQGYNRGVLFTCNEYENTDKAWWISPEYTGWTSSTVASICSNADAFGHQGTGCGDGFIQVDNNFKDESVTSHIVTKLQFDYFHNPDAMSSELKGGACVNVTTCSPASEPCSNISGGGGNGGDPSFLTAGLHGLNGQINRASINGERQRLIGDIISSFIRRTTKEIGFGIYWRL